MKKNVWQVLTVLFLLIFAGTVQFGTVNVRAEGGCSAVLDYASLPDFEEEIVIGLYRVGNVDENGAFVPTDEFSGIDALRTLLSLSEADENFEDKSKTCSDASAAAIKSSGLLPSPAYAGSLPQEKKLVFSDIAPGAYMVDKVSGPLELSLTPFFFRVADGDGVTTTVATAKWSLVTIAHVEKVWNDADDQDGIRPASVTVRLLEDKTKDVVQEVILNAENEWKYTVENLPKYKDGAEITYTWDEADVSPYIKSVEGPDYEKGTNTWNVRITNSHTPETVNVPVTKEWNDKDDQDRVRPEEVTVVLTAKCGNVTENIRTVTLNESNAWSYTETGLPKFRKGEPISYQWIEDPVPENYTVRYDNTLASGEKIINTYNPGKTSATVNKDWADENN
ncbi:MAG: Cna B-type domain-containing protein [Blautia sp.]|nr:Cna B-type domain-containing protein [Blautia sp.]